MKTICLALLALFAAVPLVKADRLVVEYAAFISRDDLTNSDGARLKSVGDILQQDRANVHKFGNPDGDPRDRFFSTVERRSMIPGMVRRGPGISKAVQRGILNGGISVFVSVYQSNSGSMYMEVTEQGG